MNLPLLLAFITFIGWGTGDLFTIVSTKKIGANLTVFWVFAIRILLSLLIVSFVPHDIRGITVPLFLFNIFIGVLYVLGNVLVSEAFRVSSAPLVGIIVQAFPALVLVFSVLIFKDPISIRQILFVAIIFLGVGLCSVDLRKLRESKQLFDRGTAIALLSALFLSIYFTFLRIPIQQYGWFIPNVIATACFPIIYLFIRKTKEKFVAPREKKVLFAVLMVGLLIGAGDFALNYGLSIPGGSRIIAPIAGASPILFVVMSYFIFKDKLTKQQVIGIITALAGIVLLTVG